MKKLNLSKSRDTLSLLIALAVILSVLSCGKIKGIFEGDESEKRSEQVDISDREPGDNSDNDRSSSERLQDSEMDGELSGETRSNRLNLEGSYEGTFAEKKFEIVITEYNGKNIIGHNIAYWTDPPYRTNLTGTFDESTGEIILYEEKNEKGTGIFEGTLSTDEKTLKGTYSPITSKQIFKWSVSKGGKYIKESSTGNNISFKDFAREYLKNAPNSKNYYLTHSQNTIKVVYTEGGMQRTTKKNMSAGSYYDEYKTTASICKGLIGNNMINYRQPVEDGSDYYDGYFKMYFKKDNKGNWELYKIDNLEPN